MFNINEIVIHRGMGVCEVSEITKMKVGNNPNASFYVLKPLYENKGTKIFVPCERESLLRTPINSKEIELILLEVKNTPALWVENDALRRNKFSEILKSGDHKQIIKLICELHAIKNEKEEIGKKLHLSDEKILNEAERLIHGELAYTMKIEPHEVAEFIMKMIL